MHYLPGWPWLPCMVWELLWGYAEWSTAHDECKVFFHEAALTNIFVVASWKSKYLTKDAIGKKIVQ